jgi:hypothetical protein
LPLTWLQPLLPPPASSLTFLSSEGGAIVVRGNGEIVGVAVR